MQHLFLGGPRDNDRAATIDKRSAEGYEFAVLGWIDSGPAIAWRHGSMSPDQARESASAISTFGPTALVNTTIVVDDADPNWHVQFYPGQPCRLDSSDGAFHSSVRFAYVVFALLDADGIVNAAAGVISLLIAAGNTPVQPEQWKRLVVAVAHDGIFQSFHQYLHL